MIQTKQIKGLSALAFVSFLLVGISRFLYPTVPGITVWVVAWAGFESLLTFYGLSWSLSRSDRAFFSMFAGGSLFRLLTIGILAYILTVLKMSPAVPLLSLVFAYFILSLVQLPFLKHGLC